MAVSRHETRATTVRIPAAVYEQAKDLVDTERSNAGSLSLNDFFVAAIQAYVKLQKRRQIDAAFAAMAGDVEYQREASFLSHEFEQSDWEALVSQEQS